MRQHRDSRGELRAVFTVREIENAKRSCEAATGGVFARVTLAVLFLYLIVISYMMLGTTGLVFVSVLALVAYFLPHLYQASTGLWERRKAKQEDPILAQESPQEG